MAKNARCFLTLHLCYDLIDAENAPAFLMVGPGDMGGAVANMDGVRAAMAAIEAAEREWTRQNEPEAQDAA